MPDNNIRTFYIYLITNNLNGMTYVGQRKCPIGVTPNDDNYMGSGVKLIPDEKSLGIENFSKEILAICYSREAIDILEVEYIKLYHEIGKAEYNIARGGNKGDYCYFSEESKQKKIESTRRYYANKVWTEEEKDRLRYWKGKKHTEEYKKKISEACKGINKGPKSEETKRKISETLKGNIPGNKGMKMSKEFCDKQRKIKKELYSSEKGKITKEKLRQANLGKNPSEETRKKISEANKGRIVSDETRKKLSEIGKNRVFTKEWKDNLRKTQQSEEYRRKLSNALKGKIFSDEHKKHLSESQKGYHWFTNGVINTRAKECPNGFHSGMAITTK